MNREILIKVYFHCVVAYGIVVWGETALKLPEYVCFKGAIRYIGRLSF